MVGEVNKERRLKRRFDIRQDVTYKVLDRGAKTGTGRTLNISSSGVWFTTQSLLPTGTPLEISMDWPVTLDISMKLMIYGSVVRSDQKGAAVAIERHQFRKERRGHAPGKW